MSNVQFIPLGTNTADGNVSIALEEDVLIVTLRLPTKEKHLNYSRDKLVGRLLEAFRRLLAYQDREEP